MALPTQLNATEQDTLVKQIGLSLLRAAPRDWRRVTAEYRAVGRYHELTGEILLADGSSQEWVATHDIASLFGRLRTGMYREGRGTWFNARYQLDHPSSYNLEYDRDEPRWDLTPPPQAYADELRMFPRDEENVPDWLMRRMAGLSPERPGPRFRTARVFDGLDAEGRPVVNRPELDVAEQDRLLDYLDGAPVVVPGRGLDTDRLAASPESAVPIAFHSDGTWVWPAAVNYYLREYGVSPEPDLVQHIRANGFTIPEVPDSVGQAAAAHVSRGGPAPPRPGPAGEGDQQAAEPGPGDRQAPPRPPSAQPPPPATAAPQQPPPGVQQPPPAAQQGSQQTAPRPAPQAAPDQPPPGGAGPSGAEARPERREEVAGHDGGEARTFDTGRAQSDEPDAERTRIATPPVSAPEPHPESETSEHEAIGREEVGREPSHHDPAMASDAGEAAERTRIAQPVRRATGEEPRADERPRGPGEPYGPGNEQRYDERAYDERYDDRHHDSYYDARGYGDPGSADQAYAERDHAERDHAERDHAEPDYAEQDYADEGFGDQHYGDSDYGVQDYGVQDYGVQDYGVQDYADRNHADRNRADRNQADDNYTVEGYADEGQSDRGSPNRGHRGREYDRPRGDRPYDDREFARGHDTEPARPARAATGSGPERADQPTTFTPVPVPADPPTTITPAARPTRTPEDAGDDETPPARVDDRRDRPAPVGAEHDEGPPTEYSDGPLVHDDPVLDDLEDRLDTLGVPRETYRIGAPIERGWAIEEVSGGWRVGWYDGGLKSPALFGDLEDAAAFMLGKMLLVPDATVATGPEQRHGELTDESGEAAVPPPPGAPAPDAARGTRAQQPEASMPPVTTTLSPEVATGSRAPAAEPTEAASAAAPVPPVPAGMENSGRGHQAAPPRGDHMAPARGDQIAPPRGDQAAPPRGDQAAPPRGDQAPPPRGDQAAPARGDQAAPARGEQAPPPREDLAAPARDDQVAPPRGDAARSNGSQPERNGKTPGTPSGQSGSGKGNQQWPIQPMKGEPPLTLFRGKEMRDLPPGSELDRFGGPNGNLTYAAGTPFEERSLVPEWVNRPYHVYRVQRPIEALAGVAIPWFNQPGGGAAFLLPASIEDLLADGDLIELEPSEPPVD